MIKAISHKKTLLMVAVLLIGSGLAWYFWKYHRPEAAAYREVSVARGDIEQSIVSTAVVQPRNRLEIKPPIPGRIEDVLVVEGQVVAQGQALAWMSSTERAALIDAARARGPEEVKRWEEMYRATPILAPIRGTVIARNREPGQTFTSADAVFVMSDLLTVKAQVDETDIALVKLRQKAFITLDAYPDRGFDGVVEQIAYDAKTVSNVTTYEVDVLPLKTPDFMRSGMTANVRFLVASKHDALLLPNAAIRVRDGRTYALVPVGDGTQVEREVRVGLTDGRNSEIAEGLAEGDKALIPQLRKEGTTMEKRTSSPLTPTPRKRN
jgi:macrolide-specific efflux system membrane fusion protein